VELSLLAGLLELDDSALCDMVAVRGGRGGGDEQDGGGGRAEEGGGGERNGEGEKGEGNGASD